MNEGQDHERLCLRYRTPAVHWTDGLPIGNGRLGAMIFGDPGRDRWQINDDTCWSGWPGSTAGIPASDEPSPEVIERARASILAGELTAADAELRKVQYGHSQAYQPLAELELVFDGPQASLQERTLDLRTAVAGWQAEVPGAEAGATSGRCQSQVFASATAGAIIGHYRWPTPAAVAARLVAAHQQYEYSRAWTEGDELLLTSRMPSDVYPPHDTEPTTCWHSTQRRGTL